MKLTKLLIALSITSSLAGCAAIERPPIDLGIVNAPARHVKAYNFKTDYDASGNLLATAKPNFYPAASVEDLNKWLCVSMRDASGVAQPEQAIAELKKYIKKLREEVQNGCQPHQGAPQ